MPQNTNLNSSPYFEDFDPQKNFYKVLFRPGFAVQTRELIQLQSVLQTQLENFGRNSFKQGDLVVPGEVGLNVRLNYVKLSSVSEVAVADDSGNVTYKKYDIKTLIGLKLQGVSSGVSASVIEVEYGSDTESDTLYVNYLDSGSSGDEERFRQGENLEVIGGVNSPLLVVGTDGVSLPTSIGVTNSDTGATGVIDSPALGFASAVKVEEGIYFANGYFVRNAAQLLVIDKYYDRPSSKVGFKIDELLVTPEQDASLYDNSRGSSNFSAPGAHRLKITLTLVRYDYFQLTDKNFIQLLLVKDGVIQKQLTASDYSLVEAALARKTFDQSGDYVVDEFPIQIREYYQQNDNLGFYSAGTDGLVNGLTDIDAEKKLVGTVGAGKAYVKGYEVKNKETKYIEIDKARDVLKRDNETIKTTGLSSFYATNVYGTVPLNAEGAELTAYPTLYLNSVFNDGSVGLNNTEAPGDPKRTISRRGEGFTVEDGVKTFYCSIVDPLKTIADFDDDAIGTELTKLWFIKTRSDNGSINTYGYADVVSFSQVKRPELGGNTYLEITVKGIRSELDLYLTNFDSTDATAQIRYLFPGEAQVQQNTQQLLRVLDYNETVTPVIGVAKPKNIAIENVSEGFNADTDKIVSKGKLAGGVEKYNTVFDLSYFAPTFFTRITLETLADATFSSGKYITGTVSGAKAVIEGGTARVYSSTNKLFVVMVSGTFVTGETIVNEDGVTAKIASENTVSHFIITNRGGNYSSSSQFKLDGVLYDTNKIAWVRGGGGTIQNVSIEDRNAVSTTYSQPPVVEIETSDVISDAAKITPVLFRDTVYTFDPSNVKSVNTTFGSGNKNSFTCDIELEKTGYVYTNSVTNFTFTGFAGYKFIECNGFGGDASLSLTKGDIIQFADNDGAVYRYAVQYATKPDGVKRSRVYLDRTLQADAVNASVVVQKPVITNANGTLVFSTGDKKISSLIDSSEDSKISYYFRRDFITSASSGAGNLTFAAQLPFGTQRFAPFSQKNFMMTVLDPGIAIHGLDTGGNFVPNSGTLSKGDIVYIDPAFVQITQTDSELTAGSVTVDFPENHFGNVDSIRSKAEAYNTANPSTPVDLPNSNFPTLKLTATLQVLKARPRLKTCIRNKRIIVQASGTTTVPFRGQDYDGENIQITSYADAFKLRYIYEGSISAPPTIDSVGGLVTGTDVTSRYIFDDGQRDTYYDISRITLKPGQTAPSGQLVIAFDYFEHSQGDFCTIDSYLHEAGVPNTEVPSFNSTVGGLISLRDAIDFRPKVDNSNIVSGYLDKTILSSSGYISFSGTSGIPASTPADDANLSYTVKYNKTQYLDRIDGVFLDTQGNFIVKKGNSSLNPSRPESISDAISLYYLYIPAYTDSNRDVRIIPVENKRYTMKDIGKLDSRIERLEYYTSLSVLEQQALNMQISDEIGLDRFKCGFFVDNFETHKGDIKSFDHKSSIDTQQSVLRPQVNEESLNVEEVNTRNDQREVDGYVINNGVISLPYTEVKLVGNSFATKTINPNPFVVLQYVGDLGITPKVDSWYDRSIVPLVTDNNTNLFVPFLAKSNVVDAFSCIYNSFVVTWSGAERSFFNINPLSTTNSEVSNSRIESATVASSSNISPQNNETPKGVATTSRRGKQIVTSLKYFARSIPVKFTIRRMKPKTEVFVYLEGKNVGRWVAPDSRFTGIAGNSVSAFAAPIMTDERGNASGILIVPAGAPPTFATTWTGDVSTVSYDESGEDVRITTGEKTLRFTSSSTNSDKNTVETFAETKFYASGLLSDNPTSIISTQPAYFKANEGLQLVQNNTEQEQKPNPLAQTFKIEGFEGGVFTTGLDLFFAEKSDTVPLRIYLTDVESEKPGKNIVPGTEIVMEPYTYLKTYFSNTVTILKGETLTGINSNASGPILKIFDKNDNEVTISEDNEITLTNEQVYTIVLSNHNGINFTPDERLSIASIITFNNANNTEIVSRIAKDSGVVSAINITNVGDNYDSASVTIESPSLPGGNNATASVFVSGNKIYDSLLTLGGRGYTEPPSVVIRGTGTGNSGAVIETEISITEPAVRMGIAIDTVGNVPSVVATKFEFDYPVYLLNNTEYALTIETDSQDYAIWASKLGETEVATSTTVTTNPSLGSVYKSQNTNNWVEDLFEDVKFTLYRAEFDMSKDAKVEIKNSSLGYNTMQVDPLETYAFANANATSSLFKNNNNIIKVSHKNHGFEEDQSYVFFRNLVSTAGFTQGNLNSALFKVSNVGIDDFTVTGIGRAADSIFGGGSTALIAANKKYERLVAQISYIQTPGTNIDTEVQTTNIIPIDSNTQNYNSYSVSNYEKTFLNEEQFFINQKVIASGVNQLMNNLDNSLVYKLSLSTTKSYLSPVIDLNNSTIKISTNRIENASGSEGRYGKRYQLIELYPVYKFNISGNVNPDSGLTIPITVGQTVNGIGNDSLNIDESAASGEVVRYESAGNTVYVKIKNNSVYRGGENLFFSAQSSENGDLGVAGVDGDGNAVWNSYTITVSSTGPLEEKPNFTYRELITATNPSNVTETYDNLISGTTELWDAPTQVLKLENDRQPINNNYTADNGSSVYARAQQIADQPSDIFRVGDLINSPSIRVGFENFFEIKKIAYTSGIDYVPEDSTLDSSAVAKYVTKEIIIDKSATAIDVIITANLTDSKNVRMLYKTKTTSVQSKFDDIEWILFNETGYPDEMKVATPQNAISAQKEEQSAYQEFRYSIDTLDEFTSFGIKIAMQTDDPAFVPKIQDIRVVSSR